MSSAPQQAMAGYGLAGAQSGEKARRIRFHLAVEPGSTVHLAGPFNDWDPAGIRMKRHGNGTVTASLLLPPGRHEYKFIVNGVWQLDPNCREWVPNALGSLNSVVEVV